MKKEVVSKEEKIYAHCVNFSGFNAHLKGKEVECSLCGKKFKRGEMWEFHLGWDPECKRFVCSACGIERGYVLDADAERDLYLYMDQYEENERLERRRKEIRQVQDVSLITALLKCHVNKLYGQLILFADRDLLDELHRRGLTSSNTIQFYLEESDGSNQVEVVDHKDICELPF